MDEGEILINENQARIIAHALHEIRPSWSIDGTMKVLDRNKDHSAAFGELMSAAVTAALDPDTQTPGRIFQVSIHWPEKSKSRLPKPPDCPDHVGESGPTCRCCWADVKSGQRPQTHIGIHFDAVPTGAASDVSGDKS